MKKIIICISIVLFTNVTYAQTSITDTIQYLTDSVELKKTDFSGKQLKFLLNKLKLNIKHYNTVVPTSGIYDTIKIDRIVLYFNTLKNIVFGSLQAKKNPGIVIILNTPILIPKAYLLKGGILDWTTEWNSAKANFLGNYVIHHLDVHGL